MGIVKRVIKICMADIHGVMDQLEDRELLLKQHLRAMEDALNAEEAALQRKIAEIKQARREHRRFLKQTEALEHDLAAAIRKNRDDIARMLIKKVNPLNALCRDIDRQIRFLDEEIAELKANLDQQKLKYAQIKHRAREYCRLNGFEAHQDDISDVLAGRSSAELSDAETELELLKRKEALGIA
jgi:phage shock protein A